MPRPIQVLIHADALARNLRRAQQATPDARLWAVVKADAYGHGIERVYEPLRAADGFALLEISEAQRVRDLGWRGPLLLLEGVFEARDLEWCSRLDLWHVVHCSEQIDMLAAHKTHVGHRVFLKLNSGMNRLGFAPQAYRSAWTRLNALTQVDEISHMTHFSDADGLRFGADGIAHQLAIYRQATQDLPGEHSLSNSAAILRHADQAQVRADWVRLGIAMYGSAPDYPEHDIAHWQLAPTMSLRSQIIGVQNLQAGDSVGYGSTFVAQADMRIGIVACGYADGYPRHAPGTAGQGTPVLVDGRRTRTLGRVSMDMIAVDLTPLGGAGFGSEVTLWGQASTGEVLPIDEVAQAAGTVGYELMCAITARVPHEVAE